MKKSLLTTICLLFLFSTDGAAQPCSEGRNDYFSPILLSQTEIKAKGNGIFDVKFGDGWKSFMPEFLKLKMGVEYNEKVISSETILLVDGCSCSLFDEFNGAIANALGGESDAGIIRQVEGKYRAEYGRKYRKECLTMRFQQTDQNEGETPPNSNEEKKPDKEAPESTRGPNPIPAPRPKVRQPRRQLTPVNCNASASIAIVNKNISIFYPCAAPDGLYAEIWVSSNGSSFSDFYLAMDPLLIPNTTNIFPISNLALAPNVKSIKIIVYKNTDRIKGDRKEVGKFTASFA